MNVDVKFSTFNPANHTIGNFLEVYEGFVVNKYSEISSYYILYPETGYIYHRTTNKSAPMFEVNDDGILIVNKYVENGFEKEHQDFVAQASGMFTMFNCNLKDMTVQEVGGCVDFTANSLVKILGKYGDASKVEYSGNDIYYDGKKVCGIDHKYTDKMNFVETVGITFYTTHLAKYNFTKPIGGISELIPGLTRDIVRDELMTMAEEFFGGTNDS